MSIYAWCAYYAISPTSSWSRIIVLLDGRLSRVHFGHQNSVLIRNRCVYLLRNKLRRGNWNEAVTLQYPYTRTQRGQHFLVVLLANAAAVLDRCDSLHPLRKGHFQGQLIWGDWYHERSEKKDRNIEGRLEHYLFVCKMVDEPWFQLWWWSDLASDC